MSRQRADKMVIVAPIIVLNLGSGNRRKAAVEGHVASSTCMVAP